MSGVGAPVGDRMTIVIPELPELTSRNPAIILADNTISGDTTIKMGPGMCGRMPNIHDHSLAPGARQTCVQLGSAANAAPVDDVRPVTRIRVISCDSINSVGSHTAPSVVITRAMRFSTIPVNSSRRIVSVAIL